MTHFCGIDFNSLYPLAFSSQQHDSIKYTDGKMIMHVRLEGFPQMGEGDDGVKQLKRPHAIIGSRDTLFIGEITRRIPKWRLNNCINFLRMSLNRRISCTEEDIGEFTYDYCIRNIHPTDIEERNNIQLAIVDETT